MFKQIPLMMLLVFVLGCTVYTAKNTGVHGRVTNSFGYPLANVYVWANLEPISWAEHGVSHIGMSKNITVTDSNGYYSMHLNSGYYEMYAADDSVAFQASGVLVKVDDEILEQNLINDRIAVNHGSLRGSVEDDLGFPVTLAEVRALDEECVFDMADSLGFYQIQEMTPGLHVIGASDFRFRSSVCDSVWIEPGSTTVCDFNNSTGRCMEELTGRIIGRVESVAGYIESPDDSIYVFILGTENGACIDSTGNYLIRFLEDGEYTLITQNRYFAGRTSPVICIIKGSTVEFDFTRDTPNPDDPNGYALSPVNLQ
jgi:hypothetical protein